MAVEKEHLEIDALSERWRTIELITENGFSIVRASELEGARPLPAGRYAFVVRDPNGDQLEVTVEIDGKLFAGITLRSRGRISEQSSYWICFGERHLADFVWENDCCPPDGWLRVDYLTPRDINLAIRWRTT